MKHLKINELLAGLESTKYLEIGYGVGINFNMIQSEYKVSIDPDVKLEINSSNVNVIAITSDEFFKSNEDKFDLIFIDGDHESSQVEKDIINAWNSLEKGGIIVMHDINPPTKAHQEIPRKQLSWTGDVWRSFVGFKNEYPKIKTAYLEDKYGLGVIYKSGHKIKKGFTDYTTTFEEFNTNKQQILGI